MPLLDSLSFYSTSSWEPCLLGGVVALLLGLMWGSFVTMASYRLPRGEDIVFKASHCPHCAHQLHFFDLVPLFSWLAFKGKCRYCGVRISSRYPLIECFLAFLFALIYSQLGFSLVALLLALITVCLLIIIVTDFEHYIIPDKAQIMLVLLAFPYGVLVGHSLITSLLGACIGVIIGLALRRLGVAWKKQEALGWGDVKFLAVVGFYLGLTPLPTFFFIAGMGGIVTAMIWRMLGRGKVFPFAPSLVAALFVMLLFPEVHNTFLFAVSRLTAIFLHA